MIDAQRDTGTRNQFTDHSYGKVGYRLDDVMYLACAS